MNRSLIVYAVLLLAAMGWAYQTWTHEDELALADKVVILPGKAEQVKTIVYRSEKADLTLEAREDDHGVYLWGRSEPKAQPEPEIAADEGEGEGEGEEAKPSEPDAPAEPEEFKVGKAGAPVIDGLAPFVAKRRLEGVGDDDLEALGLAPEPEAVLEITREGKEPKRFELGGNVFGGVNVYVRDPDDGAIYLVEARLIRPLTGGARTLPDRELTGLDERKVEHLVLRVGDRQAKFTQHNPDDFDARYWSVVDEEDKSPEATAWIEKALRLRSSRYVPSGEVPVDLAHAFDFQVHAEDGTVVTVEVLRNFDEEGQEQYFARSQHTRALVRLPRAPAAEASADLESALLAGGA